MSEFNKNEFTKNYNKRPGMGVRHLQVAVMCACVTILFLLRSGMSVAILAMTDTINNRTDVPIYNWDKREQNFIMSAFFWGYMLMQIPAGILARRFGPKMLLLGALIVNGLINFVTPISAAYGGWKLLSILRWVMGLTQGFLFPCNHTLISKWFPIEERSMLSSIVFAGVQIGTIVSMPSCAAFAESKYGWPAIFIVMGIAAFAMAAIWFFLAANSPAEHRLIGASERNFIETSFNTTKSKEIPTKIPWKKIMTSLPVWAIVFAHTGSMWMFMIFVVEIPSYIKQMLGVDIRNSGILSALPFTAMWIMSLLFSLVSDTLYRKKMCTVRTSRKIFQSISSVGPAIGCLLLGFIPANQINIALIVLTTTVGLSSAMFSGFLINHIDLSPNFGGLLLGVTNAMSTFISSFAPIANGLILAPGPHELIRWRYVFLTAAVLNVLCNTIYAIFGQAELQEWNESKEVASIETELTQPLKEEKNSEVGNKIRI